MATDIEWTATVNPDGSVTKGESWNPVRGCVKISAGCKNCYAETFAERWRGIKGHPYEQGFDLRLVPESLPIPLRWKRGRKIFVTSMSDLFHKDVPTDYIDQVFAVMALCPQHTFQQLTKRAERQREYLADSLTYSRVRVHAERMRSEWKLGGPLAFDWPLPNVWIGVSCEDRKHGVPRLAHLIQTRAVTRFVSFEPLLENLGDLMLHGIHWAIIGGESGPGARPFAVEWARTILCQCQRQGVAPFVKQLGAKPVNEADELSDATPIKIKSRKGKDMAEWPPDLRVRDFPVRG